MKKETTSKEKSIVKSDMVTGASSAAGATIGMVAGSALASEVHAAEVPDEPTSPDSHTAHTPTGHVSSAQSHGAASSAPVPPVTPPEPASDPEAPEPTPDPETPEPIPVEPDETPEVVVVDYETVTNEDGSQMDVAVLSVDGQEAYVIDENQDGSADVLVADVNGDSIIDGSEVLNIENEGLSMSALQADAMGESSSLVAENDYVNDANVDDYMA